AALFLAAMLLVSGWFFCHILCPLGAVLGLMNPVAMVRVAHDTTRCSGCDLCVEHCPVNLQLGEGDFLTRSSCIACGKCVSVCRNGARRWDLHPALQGMLAAAGAALRAATFGLVGGATAVAAREALAARRRSEDGRPGTVELGLSCKGRLLRRLLPCLAKSPEGMARYAKYHTAFYRQFYAGADENDFRALPLLRKERVKDVSPYDLLSDRHRDDVLYYGETTGSLGSPTPSFYTAREFRGARMLSHLSPYGPVLRSTLAENRTAVNGLAFGFTVAGMSFGDVLVATGAMVANVGSRSTLATPERIGRALIRLGPSVVAAAPIDFLSWARIAKEDYPARYDGMVERLRVLMTTAELCSPQRVRRLEEHFGVLQINTYACVEGFFALACPCGRQHVLPHYDAEVLDEALERSSEYGTGRFAFSNLLKRSGPLLRYLLDDQVTIEQCDCPYGYEKSIFPHGRWELSVLLDGERLNVAHFEDLIFAHGLFGDYRVSVHEDRLDVLLEDYAAPEGACERVRESLQKRFGRPVTAQLVPFGKLTAYREVRASKPLLKLLDRRAASTQQVPEVM
ncbi:MAG: 4Fe-4S binding protein, partial [Candidatus Riflebacteria bacterium]|nr:4Fe-4S binding protein [Candidatus Riflebacteria bacterium]